MGKQPGVPKREWRFRLEESASYALSCWILGSAIVLLILGITSEVLFDPGSWPLTVGLSLCAGIWVLHLVLFVSLYRSLESEPLLTPDQTSALKRYILVLGYIGALETFHVLRRAARSASEIAGHRSSTGSRGSSGFA
jgi:hypothetical protein